MNHSARLRLARIRTLKAARLLQQPPHWRNAARGVVASVEHTRVPFAERYGTVLDVGASRGQFAAFALERFPKAHIVCFEPLPDAQRTLRRLVSDRLEVHPIALGAVAGTACLNVSRQDDSSSILPLGARQLAEFPQTAPTGSIDVPVGRLCDFITKDAPSPRLLKIDVQGLELEVLRGAGDSLAHMDDIFVECSFVHLYDGQALADEVIAYLLARDFRLTDVSGMARGADGTALQADLLFRQGHA